jgi:hypothetical protein
MRFCLAILRSGGRHSRRSGHRFGSLLPSVVLAASPQQEHVSRPSSLITRRRVEGPPQWGPRALGRPSRHRITR